ncbi:MAG TPA: rhomboid family intramembrane serine protease [Bacteroidales bacterium]|nr:rhomboid family intramembrane serine protease [Bacteroidales bacterium]HSA44435.1 rhomboid family intramembrane serine protease [Bacteroidales bacterium]
MIAGNFRIDPPASVFRQGSVMMRLIIINAAVFLLIRIADLFLWLFQVQTGPVFTSISPLTFWLSVPASLPELAYRPWGIFTYMFTHEGFFHLLFNMITLYFGGQIFLQLLNSRKMLSTYILGGFTGAVFFILSYNVFPVFSDSVDQALAIGASASVLAVLIAAATYAPGLEVNLFLLGRVKLKYIALAFVLVDILSISRSNPGGHIAHLGGAAWGFLYIRFLLNKGWKQSGIFQFSTKKKRKKAFRGLYTNTRPMTDEEYNARKRDQQEIIDAILDKIAKHGYDGLSREEKEILFKAGKK